MGVQRPNRFTGKRVSRAIDDVRADAQDLPARRGVDEVRSPIGGVGLRQLAQRCGTVQDAVALDDVRSEVRQIGAIEGLSDRRRGRLVSRDPVASIGTGSTS